MVLFLLIFGLEQLKELILIDNYFANWEELSIIEEIGSLENQVEIYDVCRFNNGYFIVGGAVRYGNHGGMDAIVFYFDNGIEWYKTYGGIRDEAFLSCYYDDNLYVSGYTYSPDFLATSSNFKTGFYLELDNKGSLIKENVLDYELDIMPTVIWKDGTVKLAGYLDNFGNTDIFLFEDDIEVYSYSGQDRIFRKVGEVFLGSTTSKELGAVNRNLLEWNKTSYKVTPSNHDQTYWYFSQLENSLSLEGVVFEDEITISKEEYRYSIIRKVPELECEKELSLEKEGTVYQYCEAKYMNNIYLFNLEELYKYKHNIERDIYYESFTLLFSGSGLLDGKEIESGTILKEGDYEFYMNDVVARFSVIDNKVNIIKTTLEQENRVTRRENSFNKKMIYIPIIIIGNILYKKYR